MDVYDAIRTRYSVREYEDRPVPGEVLDRILDAGRLAPSARNTQEWKFVAVTSPEVRARLTEATEQQWVGKAPVLIAAVSTQPDRIMHCGIPAGPVDCAIALDHMSLAATAEGLGSCWIGHFDQDRVREAIGAPDGTKVIEMMAMGYPGGETPPKRRKSFDEVVGRDRFE